MDAMTTNSLIKEQDLDLNLDAMGKVTNATPKTQAAKQGPVPKLNLKEATGLGGPDSIGAPTIDQFDTLKPNGQRTDNDEEVVNYSQDAPRTADSPTISGNITDRQTNFENDEGIRELRNMLMRENLGGVHQIPSSNNSNAGQAQQQTQQPGSTTQILPVDQQQQVIINQELLDQLHNSNTPYQVIQQDMGDGQEPRLIFFIQDASGQGTFYPAVLSPQYANEMIAR